MQFTPAFQYACNQIVATFNVPNVFLHSTFDTCPNVFDDVDIRRLLVKRYLKYPAHFSTDEFAKNGSQGARYGPEKNTACHQSV